jgi:hypothetical protein
MLLWHFGVVLSRQLWEHYYYRRSVWPGIPINYNVTIILSNADLKYNYSHNSIRKHNRHHILEFSRHVFFQYSELDVYEYYEHHFHEYNWYNRHYHFVEQRLA